MKTKEWAAAAVFVLVSAAAIAAVVLVMAHARAHRHVVFSPTQRQNLASCYQNPGNGGC